MERRLAVNEVDRDHPSTIAVELAASALRWRRLPPAHRTTGRERRWLDARRGAFKRFERTLDRFTARDVFPHLLGVWHPYTWLLRRRFSVAVAALTPPRWPRAADRLRVLHLSDVHCGAFLHPEVLGRVVEDLMRLRPDIVAVTGDIVEGRLEDLDGFLPVLAALRHAPLGAWYCYGNHDYFTDAPERIAERLASVGIRTLRNESIVVRDARHELVVGGIDDRTLGTPDWDALTAAHGSPHLLLAHHPDDFYEAERRGVAVVLSGHTHGGQIRFPGRRPIVRQSRFCLDEGLYAHGTAMLVVSRGVGAVGLPWRTGAHPEAGLLELRTAPELAGLGMHAGPASRS
jgi:predicted MPP superfamily phosphohydrolase